MSPNGRSKFYRTDEGNREYAIWERKGGMERCLYSSNNKFHDNSWFDPDTESMEPLYKQVKYSYFVTKITKEEAFLEMI